MVTPGGERVLNVTETAGADALAPVRAASLLPDGLLADDEVVILVLRPSLLFIPLASATSLGLIGLVTFLLAYLAEPVARWAPWMAWRDTQVFAVAIVLVIGPSVNGNCIFGMKRLVRSEVTKSMCKASQFLRKTDFSLLI